MLTKTRDDLVRLLAAAPDPAQIVVLRRKRPEKTDIQPPPHSPSPSSDAAKEVASLRSELEVVRERAEEYQRVKDGLISDNIRLTHRISYLEEQVQILNGISRVDVNWVTFQSVVDKNVMCFRCRSF